MPTVTDALLTLLILAGLLAIVLGRVTLETDQPEAQLHYPAPVRGRHLALPWAQRWRAYAWFAAAALCWLPVGLFLMWGR